MHYVTIYGDQTRPQKWDFVYQPTWFEYFFKLDAEKRKEEEKKQLSRVIMSSDEQNKPLSLLHKLYAYCCWSATWHEHLVTTAEILWLLSWHSPTLRWLKRIEERSKWDTFSFVIFSGGAPLSFLVHSFLRVHHMYMSLSDYDELCVVKSLGIT